MRIVDSRRIRGPSLGATGPGAIVEVAYEAHEDARSAPRTVRRWLDILATLIGRRAMFTAGRVRAFEGGLALFVPASIDLLEPAVDVAEVVIEEATRSLDERARAGPPLLPIKRRLVRELARHRHARLLTIEHAARRRHVPFLFDDDRVTLGHGATSETYPLDDLPPLHRVPWKSIAAIPVGLVTGTNGKTTTTRLVARMAKLAGLVPGNTSSDGVAIDEEIVEPGDNTGGESARRVLRDPKVQIAILETARGGLLRRGLAVADVDAALITNVTADHLGEHGVLDLATLVETKAVVGHAVKKGGKLVLGADDPELVRIARSFAAERVWFAAKRKSAAASIARGETTFTIEKGAIVRIEKRARCVLVSLTDVPLTDGGAATHNVKNALAAAALAWSLGLSDDAVIAGLKTFGASDNPGRGQVVTTQKGVRVVLDFGHNPAAASELYAWARTLAGARGKVHAVLTQPGDRTDAAMKDFAKAVAKAGASSAVVWESEALLRGRAAGEIRERLVKALTKSKLVVSSSKDEAAAVRAALKRAKKGDVVVVSPSLDRRVAQ